MRADGRLLLVTVDGRRPGWSAGVTLPEAARVMRSLGARDALNLDGGGSSAMVVRGELVSRPSDRSGERAVSDGMFAGHDRRQDSPAGLPRTDRADGGGGRRSAGGRRHRHVPVDPSPGRAVVWAVGDAATPNDGARRASPRTSAARGPDRFLYLGDVYEDGHARGVPRSNYDPLYGALAEITDPTPGNHEWANRRSGYYPYWRAKKGQRQPPWSSTRIAGWEICSASTRRPPTGRARASSRWLRRRSLEPRPGDCRIAFLHRPRYSAGAYDGAGRDIAPLWNALRGRARAVLSGHDHNMQRLRPAAGSCSTSPAPEGGRATGSTASDPRLAFGNDARFGALRIVLEPGRGHLRVPRRRRAACSTAAAAPARRPEADRSDGRPDACAGSGSRSFSKRGRAPPRDRATRPRAHTRAGPRPASPGAADVPVQRDVGDRVVVAGHERPAAGGQAAVERAERIGAALEPVGEDLGHLLAAAGERQEARVAELALDPVLLEQHPLVHAGAGEAVVRAAARFPRPR